MAGANGDYLPNSSTSTFTIAGQDADTKHASQKPVECMRRPLLNNSSPEQAVYEPFLGSGTTLIAAHSCGRVCVGIEIDPSLSTSPSNVGKHSRGRKPGAQPTVYYSKPFCRSHGATAGRGGIVMRGRRPKPSRIKALTGNPGKRPLNSHEPQPAVPECPSELSLAARQEWARLRAG